MPKTWTHLSLDYQSIFLIVSNVVIFGFGIAYYKKKIPSLVQDAVEKIRTFEIPKRVAIISLAVILCVYIGLAAPELSLDESKSWSDYQCGTTTSTRNLAIWSNLIMSTSKNKTTDMLGCFCLMCRLTYSKTSNFYRL